MLGSPQNNAIFVLFLLIILIIVIFWVNTTRNLNSSSSLHCISTKYDDIIEEFELFDEEFYMTQNIYTLNDELRNSPFQFDIIESDYTLFYSNRSKNTKHLRKLNTFEITDATVKGISMLVRNRIRYVAFKVSDCKTYEHLYLFLNNKPYKFLYFLIYFIHQF